MENKSDKCVQHYPDITYLVFTRKSITFDLSGPGVMRVDKFADADHQYAAQTCKHHTRCFASLEGEGSLLTHGSDSEQIELGE